MRIRYINRYQPLIEFCWWIEMCVGDLPKNYLNDSVSLPEAKQAQYDEHQKVLRAIYQDVQKVYQPYASGLDVLFHNEGMDSCPPLRSFIYCYLDAEEKDWKKQLKKLEEVYQKDPYCLIRGFISNIDDENDYVERTPVQLLKDLDATKLSLEFKWNLMMKNQNFPETFKLCCSLMEELEPIWKKYEKDYQRGMDLFLDEVNQSYPEGGMLEAFYHVSGLHIDDTLGEEVFVYPTYGGYRSFSYRTQFLSSSPHPFLIWGLDIFAIMKYKKEGLSIESICNGLKLLSDKSKFDILCYVSRKSAYGAQIAKELKLTTPTISYHMQALMNAGFIQVRKENNRLYYSMNRDFVEIFLESAKEKLLKNS